MLPARPRHKMVEAPRVRKCRANGKLAEPYSMVLALCLGLSGAEETGCVGLCGCGCFESQFSTLVQGKRPRPPFSLALQPHSRRRDKRKHASKVTRTFRSSAAQKEGKGRRRARARRHEFAPKTRRQAAAAPNPPLTKAALCCCFFPRSRGASCLSYLILCMATARWSLPAGRLL